MGQHEESVLMSEKLNPGNYKEVEFYRMVGDARDSLAGTCPLIEDEALLWACEKIEELHQRTLWNSAQRSPSSEPISPVVMDGVVSVPVEPTREMLRAGLDAMTKVMNEDTGPMASLRCGAGVYKAMIAASPDTEEQQGAASEAIEHAHMAGQIDAGVDPSYSNAQRYAESVIASPAIPDSKVMVGREDLRFLYDCTVMKSYEHSSDEAVDAVARIEALLGVEE